MTPAKLKRRAEALAKAIAKITDDNGRHPTVFIRNDRPNVIVSAEDGGYFADYYGEYRGGYPWIHPKLEEFATKRGYFWEWEHPGSIMLCE
ncbi:MAG: hypothetical protein J2P48_17580 [Alphaproteobacteria bacterium]|nr:hypothetical protein [Alphaproteobacteria bacterium]